MDISYKDYRDGISVQTDKIYFDINEKGHIDVLEDFCLHISKEEAATRGLKLGKKISSLTIVNAGSCGVFLGGEEVEELTIEDELLKNVFRGDENYTDYSDSLALLREILRLDSYDRQLQRVEENLANTEVAWKKQLDDQIDHATQYFIDRIKAMIEYYADEDNFDEGYLDIDFVKMCQVLDSIN